jgi:hypothetical protein
VLGTAIEMLQAWAQQQQTVGKVSNT